MKRTGTSTVWLMHECPAGPPLARPAASNPFWARAIEQFSPLLTVSGHDHTTPIETGTWHAQWHRTTCVNVGQSEMDFHHCLIDFEFAENCPTRATIRAFPQEQTVEIMASD
jgi:hypothetical protein